MASRVIEELRNRLSGHLILVNLHQEASEGMIDKNLVGNFLRRVDARTRMRKVPVSEAELFFDLTRSVWNDASDFQLKGPNCSASQSQMAIFKTYSNISALGIEIRDPKVRERFKDLTAKPFETVTDDECRAIADYLTNLDPTFDDLHLSLIAKGGSNRRFIVWSTRLEELADLAPGMRPNNMVASRLRDQLGLGHFKERYPMFAFISTVQYDRLIDQNHNQSFRPMTFDGIDQIWFKHRRDREYGADTWGRATDLEKVQMSTGDQLDGGPEAVSASFKIGGNFRCVFVGRPDSDSPEPDEQFVRRLLGPAKIAEIADEFEAKYF